MNETKILPGTFVMWSYEDIVLPKDDLIILQTAQIKDLTGLYDCLLLTNIKNKTYSTLPIYLGQDQMVL